MSQLPKFLKKRDQLSKKLQSALLLLLLIAFGLFLFSSQQFFKWLSFEDISQDEIFEQVKSGKTQEIEIALEEWLRQLRTTEKQKAVIDEDQQRYLVGLLSNLSNQASARANVLALISGVLGYGKVHSDGAEIPILYSLVEKAQARASDVVWQRLFFEAMSSLALLGEPNDEKGLSFFQASLASRHELQASAVAFALGIAIDQHETGDPFERKILDILAGAIETSSATVRHNIAFALARVSDGRAKGIILELLSEAKKVGKSDSDFGVRRFELYKQAFSAAMNYDDETLRSMVREISRQHPHLKLRQAARIFVEK